MGRTYKAYFSGSMNDIQRDWILRQLVPKFSASDHYPFPDDPLYYYDKVSAIRNYARGITGSTFFIDISSPPEGGIYLDNDDFYDALLAYITTEIKTYDVKYEYIPE